jgi:long-chain acyl-CoA synthetase
MTLAQMLRKTAQTYPEREAFTVLGRDSLTWTYQRVFDKTKSYASVLSEIGLKRGDRVAVIAENSPEFAVLDWACHCLGCAIVPIYTSLPADQTQFILKDCQTSLVVCGSQEYENKAKGMSGLQSILLTGPDSLDDRSLKTAQLTESSFHQLIDGSDAEDVCTIIYTSGTTGVPKGAMMPNRAFVHVCMAARDHINLTEDDRFLNFLPMSHIYEQVAGQALPVSLGASICFSKSLAALPTEMTTFQPTIMLAVPRFLESLRERILTAVAKDKPIRQKLFHLFLSQGAKHAKGQFAPLYGLLDKLVGVKIRSRTGGHLRFFVSGGAALEPAVAEFYIAVGLTVLQGYGLTETSGGTFVNKVENNKYWTVGEPLQMETKIATDGEILLRGPGIMLGYYNRPEDTAAAIDSEGWFHTGDIGEFEGKNLKITDRKKDIIVLANGKNVAPQMVENKLKTSAFIQEAVVIGDKMEYCAALIVPNFEAVRAQLSLTEGTTLSDNPQAAALIKKEIDSVNKSLAPFEAVKKHAILNNPFSIESGELTPTLKVKRKVVNERFASEIATLKR